MLALAALVVLAVVAVAVAGNGPTPRPEPWVLIVVVVAGLLSGLALVATWAGLARGSAWGRPLAVVELWLIILSGLVSAATDVSAGKMPIPLLAIAAVLALRTRPGPALPKLSGIARRTLTLGVTASLLAGALGPAAAYLLKPGNSPLSLPPEDIDLRVAIACTYVSGVPTEARLTASWTWFQHEWLPVGDDALALRWLVTGADGQRLPYRFSLMDAPGTGYTPGVNPGRAGAAGPFALDTVGPSGDRVNELVQEAESQGANLEPVAIDVASQGLRDDAFFIVLAAESAIDAGGVRRSTLPDHGTLGFDAAYLHLGRWIVWADARSCTW